MYVKSVKLENIKGFGKLHFEFQRPNSSYAGWTVFVGGNASGKSTLLKAIALALMGPDASRQLIGSTEGWLLRGEKRAEVLTEIFWANEHDKFKKVGKQPGATFEAGIRLELKPEDTTPILRAVEKRSQQGTRIQTPERGLWNPNATGWFCAGFGPMRRLSGSSSESIGFSARGGVTSRFVTLFREDAALSESEAWLKTNHSRWLESDDPSIKRLLDGVSELLSDDLLPHGMKISKITVDHVLIKDKRGLELPMRDISDGCRSIYAAVLDLVHGMFEVYGADGLFGRDSNNRIVVERAGVVLIDEIEAHLHPAWQRDIPEWLKQHFPNVQFLVTTHSPLVVQAADQNGIFVLPSQSDLDRQPRALSSAEIEKLRLGRAEKTLLGTAFGLKTVRSHWANLQIEHWKRLNAKKMANMLSKEENDEFVELRNQMELAFELTVEPD